MILRNSPEDGEPGWTVLSPWEQTFLTDLRRKVARGQATVSELQYQKLEQIWRRC